MKRKSPFVALVLVLWTAMAVRPALAADIKAETVTFQTAQRPVSAQRFAAPGQGKRPAVILLHGRQGIEPLAGLYQNRARAVARAGMDAYLFPYYDDADLPRATSPDPAVRQSLFRERAASWSLLVRDVVGDILADPRSSGAVGLVGFSQGGFLAAGVAGADARLAALVVYYGGIPSALKDAITHLPPLLELHGDADGVVPLAEGRALVDLARQLGQPAEMTVFPGAGHGFAGADAQKAEDLTVAFLRRRLFKSPD